MRRLLLLVLPLLLVAPVLAGPVGAAPPPDPSRLQAVPDDVTGPNPWLDRTVLNIAHRGGAFEWPENTLFAFRESMRAGADVLETDVALTADGEVVVLHDSTVDRTTDGSGRVRDLTLAQVRALDAAHWATPGRYPARGLADAAYPWRGMATGARPPVDGYTPSWFRVPTLREVLETFPGVPLNVEIKPEPSAPQVPLLVAEAVADLLHAFDRSDDVLVVSSLDSAARWFDLYAPDVDTATSTGEAAAFTAAAVAGPGLPLRLREALQVPLALGVEVATADFVRDAHAQGLAVHVFTVDRLDEMRLLLDRDVDGVMTNEVSRLETELRARGTAFPLDPRLLPACPAPDAPAGC